MNVHKLTGTLLAAAAGIAVSAAIPSLSAGADWQTAGIMGDLNGDKQVNSADLVIMARHLHGAAPLDYDNGIQFQEDTAVSINGADYYYTTFVETADIDQNKKVNVFDLIQLRELVSLSWGAPVYNWVDEPDVTTTTVPETTAPPVTTTTVTTPISGEDFIDPPIYELYGSLPSQGDARVLTIYVDFPDCHYDFDPSTDFIEQVFFGSPDPSSQFFPYESISAFYSRSSKGAVTVSGDAVRYTTKNGRTNYETNAWYTDLIEEVMDELDSQVDFSQYDGDNDGVIDTISICVPDKANELNGNDYWHSCAGDYGGNRWDWRLDGKKIGHVIVGAHQINSESDYANFVQTNLHEMGHCMGLPDFYLYNNSSDWEGLHGSAGFEIMDDCVGDFGSLCKLMLGWYRQDQIQVYDPSAGEQTFKLYDNCSDQGNCLIIPNGSLADKYRSEFMILEFASLNGNGAGNNTYWWMAQGEGVRAFHAEAACNISPGYSSWTYASGENEATNYDQGRRFIRLVNEGTDETDNLFRKGSTIDSSVSDFRWYDSSGQLTVDTGFTITIDDYSDGVYTVTVHPAA